MGWCYEFGAQICEGCSAPMVASSSSCTCDQCGVVCTGRFSSCRDVWARGPQPFTVVSPPAIPTAAPARIAPATGTSVAANGQAAVSQQLQPPLAPAATFAPSSSASAAALDRVADIQSRLGALEAVAAYVQALRRALRKELERVGAEAKERDRRIDEATERLAAVESKVSTIQTIPARVDSLSRDVFESRRAGTAEFNERIEKFEARMEGLTSLKARMIAMEALGRRIAAIDSIENRVAALESAAGRSAPERRLEAVGPEGDDESQGDQQVDDGDDDGPARLDL